MKHLPLVRRGIVVAQALVDDDDYDRLNDFRWQPGPRYVIRKIYRGTSPEYPHGRYDTVYLHRQILGLEPGDPRQGEHADRNPLNNQRSNLSIVEGIAQNAQNKGSNAGSRSQYRGVSWYKALNKWQAKGKVCGRTVHLGYFADEREAAAAASAWRAIHMPFSAEGRAARHG